MTVATSGIELTPQPGSRLRVVEAPADSAGQATLLSDGDAGGILTRSVDGSFELKVAKDPRYLPELRTLIADVVRQERLSASGLAESQLVQILTTTFAAFASTIDDPNTSARTSMMFLPFIPLAMTLSVLRDPDHIASRVLALFPLTSPSAMPIRVILSSPGVVEIAAAVVILVGTIWLFRRLAGRIFEIGMLMYGKEPTLREMWRWASAREVPPE